MSAPKYEINGFSGTNTFGKVENLKLWGSSMMLEDVKNYPKKKRKHKTNKYNSGKRYKTCCVN